MSQLIRSPGVYFDADEDPSTGRLLAQAKLIPDRGAWMEFETRKSDYLTIKFNRKRTIPVTILLRAMAAVTMDWQPRKSGARIAADSDHRLGRGTDGAVRRRGHQPGSSLHRGHDSPGTRLARQGQSHRGGRGAAGILQAHAPRRSAHARQRARVSACRSCSISGATTWSAWAATSSTSACDWTSSSHARTAPSRRYDLVKLVETMIRINNGMDTPDDIDHLGNRRVKTGGRVDSEQAARRLAADGARRARAHEHPRERGAHARDPDQYPPGRRGSARVLWLKPISASSWIRPIRWPS